MNNSCNGNKHKQSSLNYIWQIRTYSKFMQTQLYLKVGVPTQLSVYVLNSFQLIIKKIKVYCIF